MSRTAQRFGFLSVAAGCIVVLSVSVGALRGAGAAREQRTPARAVDPSERALAREILEATGVKGGLIVHLGCGDGKLTAALCANDSYVVHGLDADAQNVETAREHIRSLKLYGNVSVEQRRGGRLPYTDNLVNLLVSEGRPKVAMHEVLRVLAPNGVAYIKQGGRWTKTVKPWPEEIDEWTHYLHGADNNAVAQDTVAGPPRRMQWVANPLWLRSHETPSGVSALVSARGRVFYILDEGVIGIIDERLPDTWSLIARDAFNGALLWKRPIRGWGWREWSRERYEGKDWTVQGPTRTAFPNSLSRRLVADGDRVYVTLSYAAPVTVLDAATGEAVRTLEGTEGTDEILCSEGILVLSLKDALAEQAKRRGETIPDRLLAIEADTGTVVWEKPVKRIVQLSLAIEGSRVFFHDRVTIACLDLGSGAELWRTQSAGGKGGTLVVHNGVVLLSGPQKLEALAAETGNALWVNAVQPEKGAASQDLFVANGLVWRGLTPVGLDPLTGEEKARVSDENLRSVGHHHRCYRGKATERYLMSAKEGIEFLAIQSDSNSRNNWLRGACKLGIMPCNGLLYVPPDQCFCEPGVKLLGFNALSSEPAARKNPRRASGKGRLERGPVYSQIRDLRSESSHPNDWPTYRHDPARSGSTGSSVPADVERLWQAELGGRITAPVVADGKLLVASVDTHTVHALDAQSGKLLWSYTADGRVDSPPTVYGGLVLFGSADGWVYCLRASDGKLAWRFRAAPEDRRVGAFGQLESAWPVQGSVLVQNGVVYFAAGRSSFLDGGIYLHGLDPATGKTLYEARVEGPYPDLTEGPGQCFWVEGARSEVLVGDGSSVYMRQVQFDGKLARQETPYITNMGDQKVGLHLFATSGLLDGSWYNRSFWMYSERWPGFYIANQAPKSGQLLVFDDKWTYGVKVFTRRNRHSPMFFPGNEGYLLFADDNSNEPALVDENGKPEPVAWLPQSAYVGSKGTIELTRVAVDKDKWIGFTRSQPPKWTAWIPVRIRAMVLAAGTLFIAGPPDILDPNDPLAAFEGRKGAELWAVSAPAGKKLTGLKLGSPPVFDGMIAANGRLYLSTRDGKVLCFAGR